MITATADAAKPSKDTVKKGQKNESPLNIALSVVDSIVSLRCELDEG